MKGYYTIWAIACILGGILGGGCQKGVDPKGPGVSPNGALTRYDVVSADYDVTSAVTFTASYDNDGKMVNLFQKAGQTLSSFALSYDGNKLAGSVANDKSTQSLTYDAGGRPWRVDYASLTDTGKMVYNYDAAGKLMSVLDSIKVPLKLPLIYLYSFTYDAGGNNVVRITKDRLDLKGRPTLMQYTVYTFDDKPNPFTSFPYLRYSTLLPGEAAALVNRNNILSSQVVGTILDPSSPGSVPVYDTITNYRTTRTYEYTPKGFPSTATENFNDVQFNYSGKRTFKYAY
ncbi:MAG: hypothetical protein J0H74_09245 [Chitinophagaceae bacterium]|nr:hypothetical protein [Chitinophagaceae bacterium]